MGFKTGMIVGLGAGYVLGARAGHQRYEDIQHLWERMRRSPSVRQAASRTKEAMEGSATWSASAVQRGVEKAGAVVKERLQKDEGSTLAHGDGKGSG
ncbi:MAG: YtxH domain-containing protein [Actinobacteria bacterium]|nr:YtxH domain-containing protein [Actinomycetota bacterium]